MTGYPKFIISSSCPMGIKTISQINKQFLVPYRKAVDFSLISLFL